MNEVIVRSVLLSKIPGVKHGFSTKLGDIEAELGTAARAKQVHGAKVVEASEVQGAEADGVIAREVNVPAGVITADCVPVLIAAIDRPVVAAVHAGWRGAVAGILKRAIRQIDVPLDTLRFALGPSIGIDAFEVGDEVIEAARASLIDGRAPPAIRWDNTKYHLDLRGLLVEQLKDLGIARSQVELTGGCTFIERELYHSYRRDHAGGRQLSAIALCPPNNR